MYLLYSKSLALLSRVVQALLGEYIPEFDFPGIFMKMKQPLQVLCLGFLLGAFLEGEELLYYSSQFL